MAQQRSFNTTNDGQEQTKTDTALAPSRTVGTRPAAFLGGNIDPVTGNLTKGTPQQANVGFTVTGSENPKPPPPPPTVVPTEPTRVQQIQPDPAPAPAAPPPPAPAAPAPAPFVRADKSNVIEQVGKWFCYGKDVQIMLEDGSWRAVQTLKIGDRVMLGGEVTAIGQAKGSFTFDYKGQRVSGYHAVFEEGRFIRVRDSNHRSGEDDYVGAVYPVMTERFLLVTPTHISADFAECEDGYDMSPAQRLARMNADEDRLRRLSDAEASLCRETA